jgi:phosphoribosylformimino-5-aminoimidazole carboxamide ribotide isomerase
MAPGLVIFPAIDLRGGRCVRLEQGEAHRETVYSGDPGDVAAAFCRAGAAWLHVVDLDAAFGEGSNRELILDLARSSGLQVQSGGGLRTDEDVDEMLGGGVARVVIGTAAVEQPDWVEALVRRWGADRIVVGLDARGTDPALRGWRESSGADLFEVARSLVDRGVESIVHTDIARDGMLDGPNAQLSAELATRSGARVIVSGGVGTLEDVARVAAVHRETPAVTGLIVGKALYERRLEIGDAVAVASGV